MAQENKMAYMPVNKLLLQMSAPPLISMFLQYSYNLVDSMFVAKINESALAAVSLSFPISTLMNALSIWIGVGLNVLIAGYLGQKRQKEADFATTLGLMLSFLIGATVNIIVLFFMKPYYAAFTKNITIYEYGLSYMKVCAFMQIPNMVHIAIQKILQATGNMLTPMWFQIAGVLFNFIFDPLLIFGIGPFPEMGIAGAALATVLGYTLSMIIAIIQLFFTKQKVKPIRKGYHFDLKMLKMIFSYGLPSFIMNALGSFMVNFANMFLVHYSDTAVAFFGAYFKVQQLIVMTVNGLIQGCLPIMRFNYRAKKEDRLRKTYKTGVLIATIMMLTGTLLLLCFPNAILSLFSASKEMCSLGIPAMRIMSLSFVFSGLSTMIATYEQATDQVLPSMMIQLLRQGILLIPFMWIFNYIFKINGIWISFPVTELIVFISLFLATKKRAAKLDLR
ncbi:MATE family efflux transporter [Anaerostipes sp. MSJ-23]|uniref:MATE family efflux transporter n=2 Tax=unclassified Anaerostipes TaxID=2635253 RepID=UPI001C108390|nr:MATE family efflux transporter [Anaerostipes sp. MSJ-23]MBU5460579.1 MATE family efflux transporter [Anaerostipes sp. MSJ-23]